MLEQEDFEPTDPPQQAPVAQPAAPPARQPDFKLSIAPQAAAPATPAPAPTQVAAPPADGGWIDASSLMSPESKKAASSPATAPADGEWVDASSLMPPPPFRSWADKMGIPRTGRQDARTMVDLGEGVAAGLGSTIYHTGDLFRRITGSPRLISGDPNMSFQDWSTMMVKEYGPDVKAKLLGLWNDRQTALNRMKAPDSGAGTLGKIGEQVAEFAIPGAAAAEATKGASIPVRIGAEALASGVVSAAQTGTPEGAAIGTVAGALGPSVEGGASAIAAALKSQTPRPLSQAAIDLAQKYGIKLTSGMLGGSKTVQAVEKILGHTVAPDLYEAIMRDAGEGVSRAGSDMAGNFAVDQYAAGDSVVNKLLGVAKDHATEARRNYAVLDAIENDPANLQTVTVGWKPSVVLDASGNPIMQPITKDIALPVDMTSAKATLKPIRDMIKAQMPVAQQQYSSGLHAIDQILSGPDVLSASTAEGNIGAVKTILREGVNEKTKYLAGRAVDAMEPAIQQAVAAGGPDATRALAAARQAWRAKSGIEDMVEDLGKNVSSSTGQVKAASTLLRPRDASYPQLQRVLSVAPGAKDDLGKALLSQVFDKAQTGNLSTSSTQAQNLWRAVGQRTKAALFSPQQIENVEATLELAKRVAENPNPSGTGIIQSLLKLGILMTHPVQGSAAITFGRAAAKILYDPSGATALRAALSGTAQPVQMTLLKSLVDKGAESLTTDR